MLLNRIALAGALLLASASWSQAQDAGSRQVLRACKPDIKRYCSQVGIGGGRLKACMKQNAENLSDPCKQAVFQAWLNK